jgi:hypothetical protein
MSVYLQQSRHRVEPLSHGLLSLEMLFVSISQVLLRFFALASADLCEFSTLALAAVATSKAFHEALSLASSNLMRALADARASAEKGKEKSDTKQREIYRTRKK